MKLLPVFLPAIAVLLLTPSSGLAGASTIIQRPDLTVGKVGNASTIKKGDDIYNTTAAGQTIRLNGRRGQQMIFFFCIMNDGSSDESFSFKGTRPNRKFKVTYFKVGGGNISSQVYKGNYTDYLEFPGDGIYVKTVARPKRKFHHKRARIEIKGRVRSEYDPSKVDCAKAVFINRP